MNDIIITQEYLKSHPNEIFVFGDNLERTGYGGAAMLRDEPNTYGFITKKYPSSKSSSYYKPEEYTEIYQIDVKRLKQFISENLEKDFLISKLGANLANKFGIYESIIEPNIKKDLAEFYNVKFLW